MPNMYADALVTSLGIGCGNRTMRAADERLTAFLELVERESRPWVTQSTGLGTV
jgi:hypothetical protein